MGDLAFTSRKYAPISLPYYQVTEEYETPIVKDEETKTQSRPSIIHVEEENSNAAKALFLNEQGNLLENQCFLMQLPTVLPELLDQRHEVQREQEDAGTAGAGASITRLPDGLLGKLRIYKSGKVVMEVGGLPFCVDQGCELSFRQDLACVCPEAKEMTSLGKIEKRMVLTPDIDAMVADPALFAAANAATDAKSANAATDAKPAVTTVAASSSA